MKYFQRLLKDEKNFIAVPPLPTADTQQILQNLLRLQKRAVTPSQFDLILETVSKNPLPLFLKLCFDEACHWTSFARPADVVLQDTIVIMINRLFSKLETGHGKNLVSRTLGCMTISKFLFTISSNVRKIVVKRPKSGHRELSTC